MLVNFFVIDDGKTLHQWLGYAASTLVVARSDFLRCEGCLVDWFTRLSETKDLNQVWVA